MTDVWFFFDGMTTRVFSLDFDSNARQYRNRHRDRQAGEAEIRNQILAAMRRRRRVLYNKLCGGIRNAAAAGRQVI
jgi:hypothetical protein